jgi:hypothetical protein
MAELDTKAWSGEGTFTQVLLDRLQTLGEIAFIRVEDAPASRSEADYNFVSNEIFVAFATETRREPFKRFGFIPGHRAVVRATTSIAGLEGLLTASADIGPPDYSDAGMLQYLRTERIVPPYQTRGYKLVELVRLYEVGSEAADLRRTQTGD